MPYLILVRHGKSEWNELGLWTGWQDIPLHPDGEVEAEKTGLEIKHIPIHSTYTSGLKRAKDTLAIIKKTLGLDHVPTISHEALNEKHYGIFTGKNKWQVQKEVGEETFQKIRRAWNHPVEGGETLKDVHGRVVPYYKYTIEKDLKEGKNVLVVAHGNSLRTLAKHLEDLDEKEVGELEIGLAEAHVYKIDENGKIISKEIRSENSNKGNL